MLTRRLPLMAIFVQVTQTAQQRNNCCFVSWTFKNQKHRMGCLFKQSPALLSLCTHALLLKEREHCFSRQILCEQQKPQRWEISYYAGDETSRRLEHFLLRCPVKIP